MVVDGHHKVTAIYDTGSNISLINYKLVKLLKLNLINNKNIFKSIGGLTFSTARANIKLRIGQIDDCLDTYVVKNDNFSYDLLLGLDAIRKFQLIQDENLNILQRKINDLKKEALNSLIKKRDEIEHSTLADGQVNFNEDIDVNNFIAELDHIKDEKQKKMILNLIDKHKNIFAKDKYDVGRIASDEAQIKLTRDEYVTSRPYRCSIPDRKEIEEQVQRLLEADLIEESTSPFASPVTLAYKKEDGRRSRLCIDFRKLNKLVVPEAQPFLRVDDIIEKLTNCKYFTVLDVNSAFWCIPIKIEDREKTSFVTENGHFMFKCLAFGLKNASQIFQRIMSNIIRRHKMTDFCVNYIDDILIFSKSFEQHLKHIDTFLSVVREENFRLKLTKCKFAASSVKYLGHNIEENKISPTQDGLDAIKKLARPTDRHGVRSLLGSINYYLRYVENSSEKFEPLHNLLRKNVEFKWDDKCEGTFNLIKDYLCSKPVLQIYDHEKEVVLETDASSFGLGAVLKQPDELGTLHPVFYFSRKLTPKEKRDYDTIHLECKAIKEAIKYWQYYLIGRTFTVCSDHKPLQNLRTKSRTDELLGHLVHYLLQFNFKIIYKPGKENVLADTLSRYPVLDHFEEEDALKWINLIQLDEIIDDQKENREELETAKRVETYQNIVYKKLKERKRIFLSKNFGLKLITRLHQYYGHVGAGHLIAKIRPQYYFKNLDRLVSEFCRSCSVCIQNKSRRTRLFGLLSKLGPLLNRSR